MVSGRFPQAQQPQLSCQRFDNMLMPFVSDVTSVLVEAKPRPGRTQPKVAYLPAARRRGMLVGMAKPLFGCVPAIVPARKNSDKSDSSSPPSVDLRGRIKPFDQVRSQCRQDDQIDELRRNQPRLKPVRFPEIAGAETGKGQAINDLPPRSPVSCEPDRDQNRKQAPRGAFEKVEPMINDRKPRCIIGVVAPPRFQKQTGQTVDHSMSLMRYKPPVGNATRIQQATRGRSATRSGTTRPTPRLGASIHDWSISMMREDEVVSFANCRVCGRLCFANLLTEPYIIPLGAAEETGHGKNDPQQRAQPELETGTDHAAHSTTCRLLSTSSRLALARRPPARDAGGMAKPFSMLVTVVTPKRRWAQFSLFTMFVVVSVLCVLLAVVHRAQRQRNAVAAIEAIDGKVEYVEPDQATSEAFPREFLRRWLPRDYLDEVRAVDLLGTKVTDADLAQLQWLTGLQELTLFSTQVTDAGLAHLHGLTELRELSLRHTQVTGAGLAHLRRLTKLQELYFDFEITDAVLAHLHGLTGLQSLVLDPQVTDAGLAHLQGMAGLQQLYLTGTQVTDAGLAHLHGLTGLQVLYLRGTQVTDAGQFHLHGMTGLQELDLLGTQVTGAGLAHLHGLTGLQELYVDAQALSAGLSHLQGLTRLQKLDLGGTRVTDAELSNLHGMTGLQRLDLRGTHVTDAGLAHLQGLTGLQSLSLDGTQVTNAGLAHLHEMTALQMLTIANAQVTDAGIAHLQGLTGLTSLYLRGTQLRGAGLAYLQGLTGLKSVDLSGTQVTDAGLEHLHRLTRLEVLFLNNTQVTDAGVEKLREALPKCQIYWP